MGDSTTEALREITALLRDLVTTTAGLTAAVEELTAQAPDPDAVRRRMRDAVAESARRQQQRQRLPPASDG